MCSKDGIAFKTLLHLCSRQTVKNKNEMEKTQSATDNSSNLFLTGTILLANMDYSGMADYAIKALIGGAIWMGFKIAGDRISERMKKK